MPAHAAPTPARRRRTLLALAVLTVGGIVGAWFVADRGGDDPVGIGGGEDPSTTEVAGGGGDEPADVTTTTTEPDDPAPASGFATEGLLTFRGSATRTYHGEGPVPTDPVEV